MKKFIKKFLPSGFPQYLWENIRAPFRLFLLHRISFKKFVRYNTKTTNNPFAVQRTILMLSHTIEKGFSLPKTRPFFGVGNINALLLELEKAKMFRDFPKDIIEIGITALRGWVHRHQEDSPDEGQKSLVSRIQETISGGDYSEFRDDDVTFPMKKDEVERPGKSLSEWINLRHSVRDFQEGPVPIELVEAAVRDAQRAPSACNLQPTRVVTVSDQSLITQILTVQSGSNGFKENVPLLFILSFEVGLQAGGPRSRNQGYCDTGMFSMLLMLSLLEKGISSCPLNWAKEPEDDLRLRELVEIPDSQQVVLLVGAGMMKDEFEFACSKRRDLEHVMRIVQ